MAAIRPFRALRPVPEKAERVSSAPYDVVELAEVRQTISENPLSFLRITRSEAELPDDASPVDVFERSRENLQEFINKGILFTEKEPSLYVYRLIDGAHSQTGIVACCSLDEYEQGLIKKHEKTRPDKVQDRTEHMLAVHAQTGLILLAYRGTDTIHKLSAAAVAAEPLYNFCSEDGVQQTFWRIDDPGDWVKAFLEVPALYIADGHHRAESAERARLSLRSENEQPAGEEEYNYVIAGIFPAEELRILPYNRVVTELNGLTDEEFLSQLSSSFVVTETDITRPDRAGEISMYLSGKWYNLRFAVASYRRPDPIERLDVSILQNYILRPVLGVLDERTDYRVLFAGGSVDPKKLAEAVDEGRGRVAFSLYPTSMDDLLEVSDRNEIMPPKSTWFDPKLKDGILIHLI